MIGRVLLRGCVDRSIDRWSIARVAVTLRSLAVGVGLLCRDQLHFTSLHFTSLHSRKTKQQQHSFIRLRSSVPSRPPCTVIAQLRRRRAVGASDGGSYDRILCTREACMECCGAVAYRTAG